VISRAWPGALFAVPGRMKRLAWFLFLAACAQTEDPFAGETLKTDGKEDASALGVFLNAQLDGHLVIDSSWDDNQTIQDQLLYTVGQLNGMTAVGRIDRAQISNVKKSTRSDGKTEMTYTAVMPIIWSKNNTVPQTIDLSLPLDISSAAQDAFATKYKDNCVDFGAHDVDSGSMFYYFRPHASSCKLDAADIAPTTASLSPSGTQTTGKFPEYDKVWEDGALNVVAIFGKYEDGATMNDAGIDGYNEFVRLMRQELGNDSLTTVPASVPVDPGVAAPDIEFDAKLPDGKTIKVVALLTDNVNNGLQDPTFRARYESLSTRADFIVYNGHAGLGSNIRALAGAGKWVAGQYVVVFMNGCDTFAYIDNSLSQAHQSINPDDTTGWKYIDIVNNGEPAFFASMAGASLAMFRGLMSYQSPMTYEQIFAKVDSSQLVMVTGEQDNSFTPGGGGQPQPWAGLKDQGTVNHSEQKTWTTPTLDAGEYEFDLSGTGDADLYVKIGGDATTSKYDCRPYLTGSNEVCKVSLAQPTTIGVMVNGYASGASSFTITGKKL
jgi:hypothetical protein